jgi:hypothetical protein
VAQQLGSRGDETPAFYDRLQRTLHKRSITLVVVGNFHQRPTERRKADTRCANATRLRQFTPMLLGDHGPFPATLMAEPTTPNQRIRS